MPCECAKGKRGDESGERNERWNQRGMVLKNCPIPIFGCIRSEIALPHESRGHEQSIARGNACVVSNRTPEGQSRRRQSNLKEPSLKPVSAVIPDSGGSLSGKCTSRLAFSIGTGHSPVMS